MRQDETSLVNQAVDQARETLARSGRVLPAAYMLVTRNPQTSAPLAQPTAIGTQLEAPLSSHADYQELLVSLREEAARLAALAVVLCGEALAEIDDAGALSQRRVFFVRIEDQEGVHHLHAAIESASGGGPRLGTLMASPDASDDVDAPLLPGPCPRGTDAPPIAQLTGRAPEDD
jgi:hypothetical protein